MKKKMNHAKPPKKLEEIVEFNPSQKISQPKINLNELSGNPSLRYIEPRIISLIVRCPARSSKIAVRTCEHCPSFAGYGDGSVLCGYKSLKKTI